MTYKKPLKKLDKIAIEKNGLMWLAIAIGIITIINILKNKLL